MNLFLLCLGLVLGAGIGSISTYLYLMNKYAGRPVDWNVIALTFALTMALSGALMMHR
jgi:biotin transporter BioY